MARLQDFQTVTPTDSDNLLVVQSTGQGLASVGSTLGAKLDKANPTGTGSLSLNRKSGTTTGAMSTTEGYNCEASGAYSHAEGNSSVASGADSHAEGYGTTASGNMSHADGFGTIANHQSQHVFGEYNLSDGTATPNARGNYVEIVGKGTGNNSRSNARTLDWSGNEVLAGGLKIHGSQDVMPSVSQSTGQFNGLIADGQMWAILGQIASGDAAFLFVGHRVGSQVYRKFLFADSGFTYATNVQGTVAIMYNSSVSNIQATAIRLK